MAVSLARKRPSRQAKLANTPTKASGSGLFNFLVRKPVPIPPVFLLLILLVFWCSSTFLSVSFFHVCISSRKLNLYCLSAGKRPVYHHLQTQNENYVLHNITSNTTTTTDNYVEIDGMKMNKTNMAEEPPNQGNVVQEEIAFLQTQNENHVLHNITSNITNITGNDVDIDGMNMNKPNMAEEPGNQGTTGNYVDIDGMNMNKPNMPEEPGNQGTVAKEEMALAVNKVKEQMQVLRSSSTLGRHNVSIRTCDGRNVFVYDLPPKFNKELVEQCGNLLPWVDFCQYFTNNAMGKPIPELGERWYDTHQYSLEPIFHSRILNHPCRVYNADEAKLFYVPFYGGIDILRWHFKNASDEIKDGLGLELVKWLETQDSWRRLAGKDHVFVLGKISWDFRRTKKDSWGTNFLELDQMQNPVKLLIERQPWHPNDVGVPHPTHFHPHSDRDIADWQSKLIASERPNLVSFAGGARPGAPENIRSLLIDQCKFSGGYCRLLDCQAGECMRPESIIKLFATSEFCLQPPGDSPTRKSVFDSLVSGCIPVLFDPFTAYYQYPWHLPADYTKYSVYINQDDVRNNKVEVVEMLSKIPVKEREEMRRLIVYELLPGLVYGDSNSVFEKFDDAFSISMNYLLDWIGRRDT